MVLHLPECRFAAIPEPRPAVLRRSSGGLARRSACKGPLAADSTRQYEFRILRAGGADAPAGAVTGACRFPDELPEPGQPSVCLFRRFSTRPADPHVSIAGEDILYPSAPRSFPDDSSSKSN